MTRKQYFESPEGKEFLKDLANNFNIDIEELTKVVMTPGFILDNFEDK
jgi:hypothetical protein